ncbi:MAG TPA: response regulator [Rhizomicrobium sp.]|jgi:two-component system response regulator FixJ|nr:response regulator [Rhizomicrobium sp.]
MTASVVLLVDDDEDVRDSTRSLLETAGYAVTDYASARDVLESPMVGDCLVTDVRMPEMDGLELQRELRRRGCFIPVVIMTAHGDIAMAVRAMREGAIDFVEKPFDDELLESIGRALDSKAAPSAPPVAKPNEVAAAESLLEKLTPRERDVFDQLILGRSNKLAAFELGLSTRTVESHRARLLDKLDARSVADLVRISMAAAVLSLKTG